MIVKKEDIKDVYTVYGNNRGEEYVNNWSDGYAKDFGGIINKLTNNNDPVYLIEGIEDRFKVISSIGRFEITLPSHLDDRYNKNLIVKKDNVSKIFIYKKVEDFININLDKTIYHKKSFDIVKENASYGHIFRILNNNKYMELYFEGNQKISNEENLIKDMGETYFNIDMNDVKDIVNNISEFNTVKLTKMNLNDDNPKADFSIMMKGKVVSECNKHFTKVRTKNGK